MIELEYRGRDSLTKEYFKLVCETLDFVGKRALNIMVKTRHAGGVNAELKADSLLHVNYLCNAVISMAEAMINIPGRVKKGGALAFEFEKRLHVYNRYIRRPEVCNLNKEW